MIDHPAVSLSRYGRTVKREWHDDDVDEVRGSTVDDLEITSGQDEESYLVLTLDGRRVLEVHGDYNVFSGETLVTLRWRDDGRST